jgi:hypothetical protein
MTILKFGNASAFIASDTMLFRPIRPVNSYDCSCPKGFTGNNNCRDLPKNSGSWVLEGLGVLDCNFSLVCLDFACFTGPE